jgi:hypothetical protein
MDRIEDETVRYLYFLQAAGSPEFYDAAPARGDGRGGELPEPEVVVTGEQRRAARDSIEDFTRAIQRKKEKQLASISMVGTESATQQQPVLKGKQAGRNDPCPCGSGKKYKKCCGA